ncbi:hypothetical protein [Mariprofundus sp. EBB-1]|uniref:hypothetical protein n=1 Tax=Mariprofundus sp. EBB-1 TaxID=2650971 RepID=UPI0012930766|nr:hypothetical protein [Mariprofundus sp. EBB-1]
MNKVMLVISLLAMFLSLSGSWCVAAVLQQKQEVSPFVMYAVIQVIPGRSQR